MIVSGEKDGTLIHVQLIDIHRIYFYDLVYTHVGEQQVRQTRICKDDIYADPQPGDAVHVTYMMNVVTGIRRANTGS